MENAKPGIAMIVSATYSRRDMLAHCAKGSGLIWLVAVLGAWNPRVVS
jgi:hypothetical protein